MTEATSYVPHLPDQDKPNSWADVASAGWDRWVPRTIPREYDPGLEILGVKTDHDRWKAESGALYYQSERRPISPNELRAFRRLSFADQREAASWMFRRYFWAMHRAQMVAVGRRILARRFFRDMSREHAAYMRSRMATMGPVMADREFFYTVELPRYLEVPECRVTFRLFLSRASTRALIALIRYEFDHLGVWPDA